MAECTVEPTYEEQAILNWYRARMAFEGVRVAGNNLTTTQKLLEDLGEAEQALINIGRDLNIGTTK